MQTQSLPVSTTLLLVTSLLQVTQLSWLLTGCIVVIVWLLSTCLLLQKLQYINICWGISGILFQIYNIRTGLIAGWLSYCGLNAVFTQQSYFEDGNWPQVFAALVPAFEVDISVVTRTYIYYTGTVLFVMLHSPTNVFPNVKVALDRICECLKWCPKYMEFHIIRQLL